MAWIQDQFGNPMQVPDAQAEVYSKYPSTQGAIQGQGWQVINGIIYARPGAQVPADIQQSFRTASPQELAAIQDPNNPMNNANGSFGEALKLGAGFAGAAYGLGNLGSLAGSAGSSLGSIPAATTPAEEAATLGGYGAQAGGASNLGSLASGASGAFDMGGTAGTLGEGASGARVDGVQAGIDAANSTSGYSLNGITNAESGLGGASTLGGLGGAATTAASGASKASALSRILDGTATAADYLSVGGAALPGVIGAISSSNQTSKLSDLANQQRQDEQARYADTVARDNARYATATQREDAAIGRQQSQIAADKAVVAPSQARYESTFQPGFTMANDPGYQDALDQSSKATLHALSVNGNPAGSPNAWSTSLKDNYEKTAYPALQAYRNANATTGGFSSAGSGAATIPGIGTNLPAGATAGSSIGTQAGSKTATAAIGQSGTTMADLGGAAKDVLAPTTTIDDLLKKLKGANNIFAVQ